MNVREKRMEEFDLTPTCPVCLGISGYMADYNGYWHERCKKCRVEMFPKYKIKEFDNES
jgi:hypothetical protein